VLLSKIRGVGGRERTVIIIKWMEVIRMFDGADKGWSEATGV
jgi:hypothetical protein